MGLFMAVVCLFVGHECPPNIGRYNMFGWPCVRCGWRCFERGTRP